MIIQNNILSIKIQGNHHKLASQVWIFIMDSHVGFHFCHLKLLHVSTFFIDPSVVIPYHPKRVFDDEIQNQKGLSLFRPCPRKDENFNPKLIMESYLGSGFFERGVAASIPTHRKCFAKPST